ncbi:MAG: LuxR C-terminal-related transcriptional regulator [Pseudomonadota bacterium]
MTPHKQLPETLSRIANKFGDDIMQKFAAEYGGRMVYVPDVALSSHPIAKAFGLAFWQWFVMEFDDWRRLSLETPLGPASQRAKLAAQIRALILQGKSSQEIANITGCSRSTVKNHRKQIDMPMGKFAP